MNDALRTTRTATLVLKWFVDEDYEPTGDEHPEFLLAWATQGFTAMLCEVWSKCDHCGAPKDRLFVLGGIAVPDGNLEDPHVLQIEAELILEWETPR